MTADIVERLRGLHVTRHPSRSVVECDETTILEAAARIERLEAALLYALPIVALYEKSKGMAPTFNIDVSGPIRAALEGK